MEERLRALWSEARELNLGTSGEIDRLASAPSPLQFLRDYVTPNKPCVISSASTAHWPAVSLWADPSYLTRALSDRPVSVHLTPTGRADSLAPHPSSDPPSLCFASAHVRPMIFPDALRLISDPNSPLVAYAQQQNDCFRSEYSDLAGDVDAHIPWATAAFGGALPDAVNLWIGSARSQTSFHKDHYENIYAVITGEKHFLLIPPTEAHRMYVKRYPAAAYKEDPDGNGLRLEAEEPERTVPWSSVDPYPTTEGERRRQRRMFPMYFEGPEPFRCTVRAGEMLYLPSMWFHHVRQSAGEGGRTIAINYWYDMQFDIKYAYFNFLQSIEHPSSATAADDDDDDDYDDDSLGSSLSLEVKMRV